MNMRPRPRPIPLPLALLAALAVLAGRTAAQDCRTAIIESSEETGIPFCDPDTGECATYTVAYPADPACRNGHLILCAPGTTSLHTDGADEDDGLVARELDLIEDLGLGYTIASVDLSGHQGWRILEQVDRMVAFREFLRSEPRYSWLTGKTYIWGGSRGGWITHEALLLRPDVFDGGRGSSGVTDFRATASFRGFATFWSFGLHCQGFANNNVFHLAMGQDALMGPAVDRATGIENPMIDLLSPRSRAALLAVPDQLTCGDSDLIVGEFNYWLYIDTLDSLGLSDRYVMFNIPAEGHRSPGPGWDPYFGDIRLELFAWVEQGAPLQYPPGSTQLPRHPTTEWVPSIDDIAPDPNLPPPLTPGLLSEKFTLGCGSWPGGIDGSIAVADLDGDGTKTVLAGNFEGFIEEWDLVSIPPARVWRSADLGSRLFGLAVGDADNDGSPDIVFGDDRGRIRVLAGALPHDEIAAGAYDDPLGQPIWDVRVADTDGDGLFEILFRTQDGYLFRRNVTEDTLVRSDGYVGATSGAGFDVADLEGDGQLEVVVGDESGFVRVYDATTLQLLRTSAYLEMYPFQILAANVRGNANKEVIVCGYAAPYGSRDRQATIFLLDRNLKPLKVYRANDKPGPYYGAVARDLDGEGMDDLVLGGFGKVSIADLPKGTGTFIRTWHAPDASSFFHAVAVADLDGDGRLEIVAWNREGSLYAIDAPSLATEAAVPGWAGCFAVDVAELGGDARPEIVVGTRLGAIDVVSGTNGALKSTATIAGHWPHRIVAGDPDSDGEIELVIGTGYGVNASTYPDQDGDGYVLVVNAKTGAIEWQTPAQDGSIWGIALADVDGDGTTEIVAGNEHTVLPDGGSDRSTLSVYGWNGTTYVLESALLVEGHELDAIAAGDVDGDGDTTEILLGDRRGMLKLYRHDPGAGGLVEFPVETQIDLGSNLAEIVVADLDGASPPEVLCGYEEGFVAVLRWNGAGFDEVARTPDLGTNAWGIAVADLDGDGVKDIAVGCAAGSVFVFDSATMLLLDRVDGLGQFTGAYGSLRVADVDADGKPELLVGSSGYFIVLDVDP